MAKGSIRLFTDTQLPLLFTATTDSSLPLFNRSSFSAVFALLSGRAALPVQSSLHVLRTAFAAFAQHCSSTALAQHSFRAVFAQHSLRAAFTAYAQPSLSLRSLRSTAQATLHLSALRSYAVAILAQGSVPGSQRVLQTLAWCAPFPRTTNR